MKSVVVSGATGFIGQRLVDALVRRGDRVTALSRDPARARPLVHGGAAIERWDAGAGDAPLACLEDADAVVHLAGERAVGIRWTDSVKREILESRVKSTERLVSAIERAQKKPRVFVSASGVGFYGPHGDEPLDETAKAGGDFLAQVCVDWEAAAERAAAFGVRVVRARLGIVFGQGGGALAQMAVPFRMFVGGPIASGKQVVSWVHLKDAVRIFERAIDDDGLRGPVNVVAPKAVTNEALSHAIGHTLSRPSAFRVPELALRLRFGEGADPLVTGQNAVPAALLARGHSYEYGDLNAALAEALG